MVISVNGQYDGPATSLETVEIESEIYGSKRKLWINLPSEYNDYPEMKFHLHVVFDGHVKALSELAMATISNFSEYEMTAPPVITIGIFHENRFAELLPKREANKFLEFLTNEVLPYMDSNYRVANFRVLHGHSNGGQFATYAMLKRPDLFHGVIAASPSMLVEDTSNFFAQFDTLFNSEFQNKTFVFSMGDKGRNDIAYRPFALCLRDFLVKNAPSDFRWKFINLPENAHMSTPILTFPKAYKFLYSNWLLSESLADSLALSNVDAYATYQLFFKQNQVTYNNEFIPDAGDLYYLCGLYAEKGDTVRAKAIFNWTIQFHSDFPYIYERMGYAYEQSSNLKNALEMYKIAMDKMDKEDINTDIPNAIIRIEKLLPTKNKQH